MPTIISIYDLSDWKIQLDVSAKYGPRAIARALMATFNDDPDWVPRHIGQCAVAIADYTAGVGTIESVNAVLKGADLMAFEA